MANQKDLCQLIRPQQWHKNGFVLLGFFVLGDYSNLPLLLNSLGITIAFCLASSAAYVFNDYCDIEADRKHPRKKDRPLAAGTVSVKAALTIALLLSLVSLFLTLFFSQAGMIIIAIYLLNNAVYSAFSKHFAIIDVFQIAFGFMLRIFAGTVGIGIFISEWMIIAGFMITLLIGFSKRYVELCNHVNAEQQREVLKNYSPELLQAFVIIMSSSTIITYALYTLSSRSLELHGTTNLIYTTPIVVFGIFRYLYLVLYSQTGEDPANEVLKDKQLVAAVIIWALTYGMIIF